MLDSILTFYSEMVITAYVSKSGKDFILWGKIKKTYDIDEIESLTQEIASSIGVV
jgi:hypothetical protein